MLHFAQNASIQNKGALDHQFADLSMARNAAIDTHNGGRNVMDVLADKLAKMNSLNGINAVRSSVDIYKQFDQTVLSQFNAADEFTILNDLTPLSRSVRLNATVYEWARSGGEGPSHTSMSGQIGALLDAPKYNYDGTIVPVHDNGFSFNWRDPKLNNPDFFDVIADAQASRMRDLRLQLNDGFFNGFKNAIGQYITVDGKSWKGFRDDERVGQFALTVDLTTSTDYRAIRGQFIAARDYVRITNSQANALTVYTSELVASNLEQYISDNYAAPSALEDLAKIRGIAAIKVDPSLKGNEMLLVPLTAGVIAPITGQAFGTVADPRPFYNSDYVWRNWGAVGLMVKSDYNDKKSVVFASSESGS